MNALFCVFSGTGNTLLVSERLREELTLLGHTVTLFRVKKGETLPELKEFDVLFVSYPVHAFNAPTAILSFLKKLPNGGGKSVYLIRSQGEPSKLNDASGITPRRILVKRGYVLRGEYSYVMPYNIMFRHSDGMAARMRRALDFRVKRDAAEISEGGGERRRVNLIRRMVSFTLRIEHAAMPVLGRTFRVSKKKCVGCGLCAEACPRGNIRMVDGKPKFGGHCVGCMGCAFRCPKDAIRISLLNAWRVNGAYTYDAEPARDDEVCRYCRKMYVRYFHDSEA